MLSFCRSAQIRCCSRRSCCRLAGLRRGAAVRCSSSMSAVTKVDDDSEPKLKTQDSRLPTIFAVSSFLTYAPSSGQRPEISSNDFLWIIGVTRPVTVGVGNSTPCHWRYSFGLKLPCRLYHWRYSFALKLPRRLKLPRGNFRRRPVVFPTIVATK